MRAWPEQIVEVSTTDRGAITKRSEERNCAKPVREPRMLAEELKRFLENAAGAQAP